MRSPEQTPGIYIKDTKVFYYLETGEFNLINVVPRIMNRLSQRGILKLNTNDISGVVYEIQSLAWAQERNLEIVTLYLNNHIQQVVTAQKQKKDDPSPW